MDTATLIELLNAAGYKTGHCHLDGVPPGRPDCVLAVHMKDGQDTPITGLLDHIESEEPDKDMHLVVTSVENRMGHYLLQPSKDGGAIWVYVDIPVPCPAVTKASDATHPTIAVNSYGSSASN